MSKIGFEDKVATRSSNLPAKNTVSAEDLNEIKASVNALYDVSFGEYLEFTLNKSQINNLHTTPIEIVAESTGKGFILIDHPIVKIDNDGTGFSFSSSETLNVYNPSTVSPNIFQVGDDIITGNNIIYAPLFSTGHEVMEGSIKAESTFAITGGGTNATIKFYLRYKFIDL